MSEYYWDIESIRNDRNKLVEMFEKETDLRKKYELMTVISFLDNYHFINSNASDGKSSLNRKIYYAASERTGYQAYYHMVHDFYFKVSNIKDKLDETKKLLEYILRDKDDFSHITRFRLTHDEAFYYLDQFYRDFDSSLYPYFRQLYDDRYNSFRFNDNNTLKSQELESDGFCLYVGELNKNYISINNEDTFSKYQNLVHECGHGIYNLINGTNVYVEKERFFSEIDSMFPEMVSLIDDKTGCLVYERKHNLFCMLATYFDAANYLTMHDVIINTWEDNNYKVGIKFLSQLRKKYNIDLKNIKEALKHDITDSGSYVLSFAACCELLYVYKQDKKKSLELYNRLIRIDNNVNELAQILEIIPLNEHALEVCEDINNQLLLSLGRTV